ncbi:hypothetical protein RBU55_04035 [Pseudomonas chlororaphis subsp. aurantiaca]|uniref:hypothetical protein n=1 Tax=Pseudomonas chlororaphis TaxID=587753 RepID=UPI0027DDDAC1|nr:hypothetical protein [Pseudomonas chlororaphis]WMJ00735.1 hypothetical protein RBU55_04035 [Pseudomonas chlororaphis subsp. aurantiaca]
MEALATAKKDEIEFILDRFRFHTDTTSVTQQINDKLLYLAVPDSKLDDTRKFVVGAYKEYKIASIVDGKKVIITYDTFRTQMGFERILRSSRSNEIDYDRFYDKYYHFQQMGDLSFLTSTFSHQLKDIGLSEEEVIDHGIEMLATADLIRDLKKEGDFTYQDEVRLATQCEMSWKKIHNQAHGTFNQNTSQSLLAAQACYDATLKKELKLKNISLPDGFSKGKFIALSDIPSIGWKVDWKDLYSK